MPILFLILFALAAGVAAGLAAWRLSRRPRAAGEPELELGREVGETVRRHPALRTALDRRLDPDAATGLALTLALLFTVAAGIVLGLLAYLVRTNATLASIDNSVARWGSRHAGPFSIHVLDGVTQLGSIYVVVGLCVALGVVELVRAPSVWIVPFLVAVVGGEELVATVIKHVVDRTRPTFNPAAAGLGPSFPSGHSTTAAAFYAAAALLLGRRRSRLVRSLLTGLAVGLAVAVASSRVLLDVHWLTDVIGGLALGWAWFALSGIAFGGRLLRFGAVVEEAERAVKGGAPRGVGAVAARRSGRSHLRAVPPRPPRA